VFCSVPLTSYFLDCIPHLLNSNSTGDSSSHRSNVKLVKAYSKLIRLLWIKSLHGKQTYSFLYSLKLIIVNCCFSEVLSPSSIATEIRSINPSFRSYTQQVRFYFIVFFQMSKKCLLKRMFKSFFDVLWMNYIHK